MPPAPAEALAEDDASALLVRVASGDRAAFRALVLQLHGPAVRLATRTLGNPADAEDAVQAALTKLWTHAGDYDPARGSAAGWFRRILVNRCLDQRRRLRLVAPLDEAAGVAEPGPGPHAAAETNARARALDAAMARLNPRQRAAIALFHGDGAAMTEIAAALETTPKAVEGLLARARIELSRLLAGQRDHAA